MSNRDFDDPKWKAARYRTFLRDEFTCQECHAKGKKLECHHIERYADNIQLRYVGSNLITLCKECHERVTGHELAYEAKFKGVIELKAQQARAANKGKTKEQNRNGKISTKGKWKPRNTNLRF